MSSWFFNEKNKPQYVAIPIESDIVQLYEIDDKYQCPDYCGIDHIHKIHRDLHQNTYKISFDKNSKIKKNQ